MDNIFVKKQKTRHILSKSTKFKENPHIQVQLCQELLVIVPYLQGRINKVYNSFKKEKIQNDSVKVRFYNSISKQLSKVKDLQRSAAKDSLILRDIKQILQDG
jgi:hypothetical protein